MSASATQPPHPRYLGGPRDGELVAVELLPRFAIMHPTQHAAACKHLYSWNCVKHRFEYQGETFVYGVIT